MLRTKYKATRRSLQDILQVIAEELRQACRDQLGRNLEKVARFFVQELRRTLQVRAPLRRAPSGRRVAKTRARPGAPPRRITHRLYRGARYQRLSKYRVRMGVWDVPYAVYLEYGGHPFLAPTWNRAQDQLGRILLGR